MDDLTIMTTLTPRAAQVLELAKKEAVRFHHNFIGTEHILLGIVKLDQGTACEILKKMGVELETLRIATEKEVGMGPDQEPPGRTPYTPRVKKVIALAHKEAKALDHLHVGIEHLLLGLLKEGDGTAYRVLNKLGVEFHMLRRRLMEFLDPHWEDKKLIEGVPAGVALILKQPVTVAGQGFVVRAKFSDLDYVSLNIDGELRISPALAASLKFLSCTKSIITFQDLQNLYGSQEKK